MQPPTASGSAGQRTPQGSTASQNAGTEGRAAQTSTTQSASPRGRSGATERAAGQEGQAGASRSENFGQLENDREARLGGAQRFQQYGAMRGSGSGGFRGAGGRAGGFRR